MKKQYPTQARLKELFDFDGENFLYRVAPYRHPELAGRRAGRLDKRDLIFYVPVDGTMFVRHKLVSIFLTGELPPPVPHHTKWTGDVVRKLVSYDPETGVFTRLHSAGGAKAGSRADYVENNGYRHVVLEGKRFLAARLAWLYMTGSWPKGRVFVDDGNPHNLRFSNLRLAKFGSQKIPENKRAYDKAKRKANPAAYRRSQLKRDFGLSEEEYRKIFVEQGGVCACCGKAETNTYRGRLRWLAVDHDHADGAFRGLLCSKCNQAIGLMGDNPDLLRAAARYLEKHSGKESEKIVSLVGRKIEGNTA